MSEIQKILDTPPDNRRFELKDGIAYYVLAGQERGRFVGKENISGLISSGVLKEISKGVYEIV